MKFIFLLKESARYVLRSSLFLWLLIFSFLLHYFGLELVRHMTVHVQGIVSVIGPRQAVFVSLFLSLFMGVFLAAVYGIWMVPYLHEGPRAQLTFVLPVSKWVFPLVYALTLLGLILIEFGILFGSLGMVYGKEFFSEVKVSWPAVATCLVIEFVAFEFLLFAFSFFSLTLGQITTFFIGAACFIVLPISAVIFRSGIQDYLGGTGGKIGAYQRVYERLPPIGELIFKLNDAFSKGEMPWHHLVLWILWIAVFICLFRWRLRFPVQAKSTES